VFGGGETGLSLSVDGAHPENVAFRAQRFAGVFIRDVDRWSIDDVVVERPGRYGVWLDGATHGRLRRVSVSGAQVAGIAIGGCTECDVLVDSVSVATSRQGLVGTGAGSLVVRGSTFARNGVGIALRSDGPTGAAHRGAHIYLNTFRDNTRAFEATPSDITGDLPVGAGVWIDGGAFDVIERNDLAGHSFGVVLTGPSAASRVSDNVVSGSTDADVAWDGLGTDVCFAANLERTGGAASSMPAGAETIYRCDLPATVGVPFPLVDATLLARALGVHP
jgi:nitrous oxidase accessory protein NosD